ncbi:unnamed protein product, partial [Prorocentrum cordatum]
DMLGSPRRGRQPEGTPCARPPRAGGGDRGAAPRADASAAAGRRGDGAGPAATEGLASGAAQRPGEGGEGGSREAAEGRALGAAGAPPRAASRGGAARERGAREGPGARAEAAVAARIEAAVASLRSMLEQERSQAAQESPAAAAQRRAGLGARGGLGSGSEEEPCAWGESTAPRAAGAHCGAAPVGDGLERWAVGEERQDAVPDAQQVRTPGGLSSTPPPAGPSLTTVQFRNLPYVLSRNMFVHISKEGSQGRRHLVYLPVDFATAQSLGYGFVNAVNHAAALHLFSLFEGFRAWPCQSRPAARRDEDGAPPTALGKPTGSATLWPDGCSAEPMFVSIRGGAEPGGAETATGPPAARAGPRSSRRARADARGGAPALRAAPGGVASPAGAQAPEHAPAP